MAAIQSQSWKWINGAADVAATAFLFLSCLLSVFVQSQHWHDQSACDTNRIYPIYPHSSTFPLGNIAQLGSNWCSIHLDCPAINYQNLRHQQCGNKGRCRTWPARHHPILALIITRILIRISDENLWWSTVHLAWNMALLFHRIV